MSVKNVLITFLDSMRALKFTRYVYIILNRQYSIEVLGFATHTTVQEKSIFDSIKPATSKGPER